MGKIHATCIQNMKAHELVAVVDNKIDKVREFSAYYGGNPYVSLDER